MNTMTLSETTAIATAAASSSTCAAGQERRLVALSLLRPSSRNVRRSGGTSIPELAASIARVGLLHNLAVVQNVDGERFDVVAGRRRLAALKLLVKRRKLAKDFEVPCLLVPDGAARTVSLTENVQRESMHPADQFEAFAALVAEGHPVEDIAADFGVSPLVVQRRLKLANVSPRLLADYRVDAVTLDQLMALAITDDPAAQEAAFYDSPDWQRSPDALREHLTQDELSAAGDALARFVGLDAYEAAGGALRRDLFSDEQQGAYLTDPALLDRLARDKLADTAEQVRGEGWAWIDVVPRATYAELHVFQRARRERRQPTKAEAKRIAKLEAEQQALQDRLDDEEADVSDEDAQGLQDQLDALGDQIDAINQSLTTYAPEVLAQAGAVVAVDHAGAVVVHRGLLRGEQAQKLRERVKGEGGATGGDAEVGAAEPPKASLSEKLVRRLSAHRTAALQAEVARHPQIALVLLVHHLARRVICNGYEGSPINISATSHVDGLVTHAPDIVEAPAALGLRAVCEAWAGRLPDDSAAMFEVLLAMPQTDLIALLAVCVASTVGAIQSRETEAPASLLARALDLDMHVWWTPTAAGYFEHVSKAKALEAVAVFAPDQVTRLSKLKKGDLASEAERLAAGSGWLPAMLCAPSASERSDAASSANASSADEDGEAGQE
ncbi:ParB/RepB/Spo0J family partition protein [Rhizobacter sp. Root404]|uniref:ParB/RepB/Spo0J family partition protein n=1 Tax=Rhizobacter sp. Root404 TaxID=1736528 RepID=UPI0006F39DAC|nr:ParB/RepB/Spo0J family partition protein [Rhizobacter sp. Root404]KQW36844.1 chromosome partitioning protein ParB [Rhizobacter sp. Root404]